VQVGDSCCGNCEGVTGAAGVAQDLVSLESGQGVFNAGPDFTVASVVVLFPGRQLAAVTGFGTA
jgi:hypothetical protein